MCEWFSCWFVVTPNVAGNVALIAIAATSVSHLSANLWLYWFANGKASGAHKTATFHLPTTTTKTKH